MERMAGEWRSCSSVDGVEPGRVEVSACRSCSARDFGISFFGTGSNSSAIAIAVSVDCFALANRGRLQISFLRAVESSCVVAASAIFARWQLCISGLRVAAALSSKRRRAAADARDDADCVGARGDAGLRAQPGRANSARARRTRLLRWRSPHFHHWRKAVPQRARTPQAVAIRLSGQVNASFRHF